MAQLTIELRRDPQSGKHDVVIHLESDADALPHEHEDMHREFVEKIIVKGKVGKVIVERDEGKEKVPERKDEDPAPQAQGNRG